MFLIAPEHFPHHLLSHLYSSTVLCRLVVGLIGLGKDGQRVANHVAARMTNGSIILLKDACKPSLSAAVMIFFKVQSVSAIK